MPRCPSRNWQNRGHRVQVNLASVSLRSQYCAGYGMAGLCAFDNYFTSQYIDANWIIQMPPTQATAKFAGAFFTDQPDELAGQVKTFVSQGVAGRQLPMDRPRAIISPHAGYRFSGAVAGRAFGAAAMFQYDQIVILSPSHRHGFDGLALPEWSEMQLPNGVARVAHDTCQALLARGLAHVEQAAHANEHGVETQLPFVVQFFKSTPIVPLVVGRMAAEKLAAVVDYLDHHGQGNTLFVISSDLSHFLTDQTACALDLETAGFIEQADWGNIKSQNACGWGPLSGVLASGFGGGLRTLRLDMANSSRVTNDSDRVVGYGAWAMYPPQSQVFNDKQRGELLRVARGAAKSYLRRNAHATLNVGSFGPALQSHMASFVTLTHKGRLRGCIGSLQAHQPLVQDVAQNVVKSAVNDRRFTPLTHPDQMDELDIKIAVLTRPHRVKFNSKDELLAAMMPHVSGMIVQDQGHRGTFLPMVWDSLPTPEQFWNGLLVKAGLPKGHWSDTIKVWHFYAESFADPPR